MNKSDKQRLYQRQGLDVEILPSSCIVVQNESVQNKEQSHIMNLVFKRDDLTGKPMNDLTLVEDINLSPNVREFIKQNMQKPVTPEKAVNDYGLAEELCRRPYESTIQYSHRLSRIAIDGEESIKASASSIKKYKKMSNKKK